jgi:GTP-binding protein
MEETLSPETQATITKLFRQQPIFIAGAASEASLPPPGLPEIALGGRSNVGKSSLVNALLNHGIARTSQRPGHTQQLNFFQIGDTFMLVDMPGYGYAEASKAKISNWTRLMRRYLAGRVPLCRTLILIDSRHGLKPVDEEMMSLLDKSAAAYVAVLTKIDEISVSDLAACRAKVEAQLRRHPAAFPSVIATSAKTGAGIPDLQTLIYQTISGQL